MHLAIILDGNRRWAKERSLPKFIGHKKGLDNLEKIVNLCVTHPDIDYLTVYALSTENMKREEKEVKNLLKLISDFSKKWKSFKEKGISVTPIGDIDSLPDQVRDGLKNMQEKTKDGENLHFFPGVNYGGQDEVIRAFKRFSLENNLDDLDISNFKKYLDTADAPPVDLMIRTGGKKRLSNFLLFQVAYAELYFIDKMWPAFDEDDLSEALGYFKSIKRNFGK